ncbi:hypothetical protein BJV82DRAFT_628687 [Fennellomyces sp. T-0311]|nr:hypothetical protein BJV82DRAFT_628687 [Fennellomyces sp. T-0311]
MLRLVCTKMIRSLLLGGTMLPACSKMVPGPPQQNTPKGCPSIEKAVKSQFFNR